MKAYRVEYLGQKYFIPIKNIQYILEYDTTVSIATGYSALIVVDKKSWNKKEITILDTGDTE